MNLAFILLYQCEENVIKESVQGYINGIGDHNETNTFTLDNIST